MDLEKVEGAILGAAVADALGVPGEFMSREALRKAPVTDMIGGGAHGQLPGTWSDDTSMILCVADSLIHCGINFDDQMERFCDWLWDGAYTARDEVFDVGGTTKQAIFRFAKCTPALECGETAPNSCGNGSLMRIMPMALYLVGQYGATELNDRLAGFIHDASRCTHAHLRCQMACGIYCSVVFQLWGGGDLRNAVRFGILSGLSYYKKQPEFAPVYPDFTSLEEIETWEDGDVSGSGYVLHTLQSALWCLLKTDNYYDCVVKAVNLGEDTDTTATVAGALAGLWYGEKQIPKNWRETTAKYDEIKVLAKGLYHACIGK